MAGDVSTPWWFPFQTTGGSIREDRLVLPIPPGVRWDEAMPEVLPGGECGMLNAECGMEETQAANPRSEIRNLKSPASNPKSDIRNPKSQGSNPKSQGSNPQPAKPVRVQLSGWQFVSVKPAETTPPPPPEPVKPKREKKPKRKHDAKVSAAARELRDRWLERINAPGASLSGAMLPGTTRAGGKYDVSRPMLPRLAG